MLKREAGVPGRAERLRQIDAIVADRWTGSTDCGDASWGRGDRWSGAERELFSRSEPSHGSRFVGTSSRTRGAAFREPVTRLKS